jgi:hypothetical protein
VGLEAIVSEGGSLELSSGGILTVVSKVVKGLVTLGKKKPAISRFRSILIRLDSIPEGFYGGFWH